MTAADLAFERADLVEDLYEIEQAAQDVWTDREMDALRIERNRVIGRINAIDEALAGDECTPTGEP